MTEKPSREQYNSKREKARRKHEQESRQRKEQRRKDYADLNAKHISNNIDWKKYEA